VSPGRVAPALALAVAGLAVLPLAWLLVRAAEGGGAALAATFASPRTWRLFSTTVGVTGGALLLAAALAAPLAWLVTRSDLPLRRPLAIAAALPLAIPSYIGAFALVAFAGPRGALQSILEPFGVERLPGIVYGPCGAILALALFSYPYLYLPLVAALRSLDPALEESAKLLGAGKWRRLATVVLPQVARPAAAGCLLVALYALADFGAVSITRTATLTVSIDNAWRSLLARSEAASLALLLVALAGLLVALENFLVRGLPPAAPRPARPSPRVALGRFRPWALAYVLLVVGGALLLPLSLVAFWALRGLLGGLRLELAAGPGLTSAGLAIAAALLALAAAWPIAWWSARGGGLLSRFAERCAWLGHGLPGIVLALGLVFLAIRFAYPLYQSLALLVAAYVLRFLPEALGPLSAALARLPPALEEAARSLGRRPAGVAATIVWPLARPGALAGAGLVALTTLKELPATLILRPIGVETLATRIWRASSEGLWAEAALPAALLILVAAPITWSLALRPLLGAAAEDGAEAAP
jgi:iron(III) transport system permease protein